MAQIFADLRSGNGCAKDGLFVKWIPCSFPDCRTTMCPWTKPLSSEASSHGCQARPIPEIPNGRLQERRRRVIFVGGSFNRNKLQRSEIVSGASGICRLYEAGFDLEAFWLQRWRAYGAMRIGTFTQPVRLSPVQFLFCGLKRGRLCRACSG